MLLFRRSVGFVPASPLHECIDRLALVIAVERTTAFLRLVDATALIAEKEFAPSLMTVILAYTEARRLAARTLARLQLIFDDQNDLARSSGRNRDFGS